MKAIDGIIDRLMKAIDGIINRAMKTIDRILTGYYELKAITR